MFDLRTADVPLYVGPDYVSGDDIAIVQVPSSFPTRYIAPMFEGGPHRSPPTRPAIVGSMPAFGALLAVNLARAYAPEEALATRHGPTSDFEI